MVREFGLSPAFGPVGYPESGSVFLGGGPGMSSRPYVKATQAAIDHEVSKLLRHAEERAIELLKTHRPELDALVDLLLERETVDGSDVYRLAGWSAGPLRQPYRATDDGPRRIGGDGHHQYSHRPRPGPPLVAASGTTPPQHRLATMPESKSVVSPGRRRPWRPNECST